MVHKFPIMIKAELDSPQRKRLFNSAKALKSLGIKRGMVVADIGCGTGFFTVPSAGLVGAKGEVLAVDISKKMLNDVRKRVKEKGINSVRIIQSCENKIPIKSKKVDYCLLASVVHELENKNLFFKELKRLLNDKGKIGIIEWKKVSSPLGPPFKERIPMPVLKKLLIRNGFSIKKTFRLGRYNYGIIATVI